MTERELEQRLRAWFQAEVGDGLQAPAELRASVVGLPDTMPTPVTLLGGRRNLALLATAAMLTALLIGGALAVGSGLIRLPWLDDDRADSNSFPLAGPVAYCDPTLADGVLLTVVPLGSGEWPGATQLTVYEDGLVLIGFPTDWGGAPVTVGLDGTWSQRRLTAEGVSALMDAVTNSLPSCQSFEFAGHMDIRARAGADVFSIGLGLSILETRQTTAAQQAAASDLAERLRDPDLGLTAARWAEDQWHPYLPERWRFLVQFTGPQDVAYPSSDGVVLPDGSTLQTFGSEAPNASDSGWTMVRCGATDTKGARAIAAILTGLGAGPTEGALDPAWRFTDGALNAEEVFHDTIAVNVVGLLPHEPDCPSDAPAAGAQPAEPPPSPSTDRSAPFTDACDYVPASLVGELIGPTQGSSEHYPEWTDDWAFCWHPVSGDGLVIFSSRRSFPSERAADQATSLFGDGNFSTEQIAGRDVFFGGCAPSVGQCRAAVAISTEPHFVVITWNSQATLRQLAERLIPLLETVD
ncbi:MAG: hypothetical protein AABM41_03545 [Chloroflexota bacterium]